MKYYLYEGMTDRYIAAVAEDTNLIQLPDLSNHCYIIVNICVDTLFRAGLDLAFLSGYV